MRGKKDTAIDIPNGDTAAGISLVQFPFHGEANQRWNVIAAANGLYRFTSVHSKLALAATNDTLVQAKPDAASANQLWGLRLSEDGFFSLINGESRLSLEGEKEGLRILLRKPSDRELRQNWMLVNEARVAFSRDIPTDAKIPPPPPLQKPQNR